MLILMLNTGTSCGGFYAFCFILKVALKAVNADNHSVSPNTTTIDSCHGMLSPTKCIPKSSALEFYPETYRNEQLYRAFLLKVAILPITKIESLS
jgi:hypothetical protein